MTIQSYIQLTWFDDRLTWNPAEFGKLAISYASVSEIWVPDITIYGS